jgi:hypothetical protein
MVVLFFFDCYVLWLFFIAKITRGNTVLQFSDSILYGMYGIMYEMPVFKYETKKDGSRGIIPPVAVVQFFFTPYIYSFPFLSMNPRCRHILQYSCKRPVLIFVCERKGPALCEVYWFSGLAA